MPSPFRRRAQHPAAHAYQADHPTVCLRRGRLPAPYPPGSLSAYVLWIGSEPDDRICYRLGGQTTLPEAVREALSADPEAGCAM